MPKMTLLRRSLLLCLSLSLVVACGGSKSKSQGVKAGGPKTPAAAKSAGAKSGSAAQVKAPMSMSTGATLEGVVCDADSEGLAFCASETDVVVCLSGTWWDVACATDVQAGSFCFYDESVPSVDCVLPEEEE